MGPITIMGRYWLPVAEEIQVYLDVPAELRKDFYCRNAARIYGWDL